jgi:hypothetical protein
MADECNPITLKINTLLEYLKQPSTVKAIGTLAGAVGYAIDPTKALEILLALQAFIGAINLLYDKNPSKPHEITVAALDKILTKDVVAAVQQLRKDRAAVK